MSRVSVAQSLVECQFVEYMQHKYMIKRPGKTVADETVGSKADDDEDDDDDDDDDDASRRERSILVRDVPAADAEAVKCLLENEKTGGGAVELRKRDDCTGTMLFTFRSKDGQSLTVTS